MQLGTHLRELWRTRLGAGICLLVASLAALSSLYKIHLAPPSLESRSLEIATASTRVLVDTPSSTVLDLRQSTSDFESMTNRAVLLGNVMASLPVRDYIGARAHIPAYAIQATTPLTADFPRPVSDAQHSPKSGDLFKSTDEFRLNIQANPTVPILDVYAEAPTRDQAVGLANGAVDGLRDYLAGVARIQGVGPTQQVRLSQLGRATGGVINHGVRIQAAILAFLFAFAITSAAMIFVFRVRRGWREGAPPAPAPAPAPSADGIELR